MGTTPNYGFPYPDLTDGPNVPADMEALAVALDGEIDSVDDRVVALEGLVNRAFPCTSGTRPVGIANGYLIHETDTGSLRMYDGTQWRFIASTGAVSAFAEYGPTANQNIDRTAAGSQRIIAFGTAQTTSPLVVRGNTGSGHYFRLQRPGRWLIATTQRWAFSNSGGERYIAILCGNVARASDGTMLALNGRITHNLSATVQIAPGQENTATADVHCEAYHDYGPDPIRTLEANAGGRWGSITLTWLGA